MSVPSKSILSKLIVRQLPLPGTALACHTLRKADNASVRDVVRVLATDPISALSVIKRANAAYYGLQGTINSLTHAVEILGTTHVLRMLCVDQSPSAFNVPLHLVMQHGFVTAQIAHRISGGSWLSVRDGNAYVGGVFTAGLLHNIGRLATCITFPKEAERMYGYDNEAFPVKGTLRELEKLQFGADYIETGTFIAQKYRLPSDLVDVIRMHADPQDADSSHSSYRLVMTINAAAEIASSLGYGFDPQGSLLHDHSSSGLHWLENEQPGCFMDILRESHDRLVPLAVFDVNKQPFLCQNDRIPIAHQEPRVAKTKLKTSVPEH